MVYAAFVLYKRPQEAGVRRAGLPRVGFSVSKKVGNAVCRNRIKRRFRHAAKAEFAAFAPGWDYVFIIRSAALCYDFAKLCRQIGEAARAPGKKPAAQRR